MDRPNTPNILFIVSDEERRNDWLEGKVALPAHERLRADGVSFTNHFTHASPCSPSRASLYTGQYLAQHGVVNNVSFPSHVQLDPSVPTIGSLLNDVGYESAYVGKWHLSHGDSPPMANYGFSSWEGNDKHFTGNAWTGRHFDPIITSQATTWLDDHANADTPWMLTVALVNPHDIMWYPIDQPSYLEANPQDKKAFEFIQNFVLGDEVSVTAPPEDYERLFDQLPANFHDDLDTKPGIQKAWQTVRNSEHFVGSIDIDDHDTWLRGLDYYAWLHQRLDDSLSTLLAKLDEHGMYDDTMIIYTSDHGDAAGSHGLRAKLPCVYDEVMGVPLIVKPAGGTTDTAGTVTEALSSSVDVAATIVAAGGGETAGMKGTDLSPVVEDPTASVRDYVLFAQDSAQSDGLAATRYALRGFFDGETKYARYYGQGGGIRRDGSVPDGGKQVDVDAAFEDQEHEWYESNNDPHELTNLANDQGRKAELSHLFERLKSYEATDFAI